MSIRFTLLTVLLAATSILANGQAYLKESNNWYFGNNAGLRFYPNITAAGSGGNPIALDSALTLIAGEGTSAISDTAGNLLFYVGSAGFANNNSSIFNRNQVVMQGGDGTILGGSSSSQNAICIRQPGSFTNYYVFSVAQQENQAPEGEGFYYTRVDMAANNGLGAVDPAKTSVEIIPFADEKVTAVLHRNKRWVWVVSRVRTSNQFVAVLLSDTGVSAPIFSTVGITNIDPSDPTSTETTQRGCMKLSPNGNRLAVAYTEPLGTKHYMQILKFNNLTGEVTEPITLTVNGATSFGPYGVEFSPDNSKVYFSDRQRTNIYQYDLCAGRGDSAAIVNSKKTIPAMEEPMTLQLGLNGRIYIARGFSGTTVAYIKSPNAAGVAACQFTTPGVPLAQGTTTDRGLTNVNQSIFNSLNPKIDYTKLCEDSTVRFGGQADCQGTVAQYFWNFGDSLSGAANVDTAQNTTHRYTKPGTYTVQLIIVASNVIDTTHEEVTITPRPRGFIFGEHLACKGVAQFQVFQDTTNPALSPDVTKYFWHVAGTASYNRYYQDTAGHPRTTNTIQFNFDSNQVADVRAVLYSTTLLGELCPSDTIRYSVLVSQRQGLTPYGLDTACLSHLQPYILRSDDAPRSQFRWTISPSTGIDTIEGRSTSQLNIYFNASGPRSAQVDRFKDTTNKICYTASPTFKFYISAAPGDSLRLYGDSSICDEQMVTYVAQGGNPGSTYLWGVIQPSAAQGLTFTQNPNSDSVTIHYNAHAMDYGDNKYFVTAQEVSREGCPGPLSRHAVFNACQPLPNVLTINGDGKNDNFNLPNSGRYTDNDFELYNRYGRSVYKKTGFDGVLDTSELEPGTYFYRYRVVIESKEYIYRGWVDVNK